MTLPAIEWAALTDDDLTVLKNMARQETTRRADLANIPSRMDRLTRDYLDAEGVEPGQEWRQPRGSHDAYPKKWRVTHQGKAWVSLTPANVWEPGVSAWREVAPEGTGPAAWVQPTGAHDAYPKGWQVTHNGKPWTSDVGANVWEPGVSGWTDNTPEPEPGPEVEPEPETGRPAWDGNAHAYKTGDEVDYEGAGYRVRQAHTSQAGWTPDVVPSLYEAI